MTASRPSYAPARWLPGAHLMTVFASVGRVFPRPRARRERVSTPDGDFLDLDWAAVPSRPAPADDAPYVVVVHGLEGSEQ